MGQEPIIAKIVFDKAGGLGSSVSAGKSVGSSSDTTEKNTKRMDKTLDLINGSVVKIAGVVAALAGSSPLLLQSLQILIKAISLPLRIIGDVMAMVVRPLGMALLRLFIPLLAKWYSGQGKLDSQGFLAPGEGAVNVGMKVGAGAIGGAMIGGAIGGLPGAGIGAMAGVAVALIKDAINGIKDIGSIIGYVWDFFIVPFFQNIGAKFTEIWDSITGFVSGMFASIQAGFDGFVAWFGDSVIAPLQTFWVDLVSWLDDNLIQPLKDAWVLVTEWFVTYVIDPFKNAWNAVVEWFKSNVIEPIKTAWQTITTWFTTNIVDPLKNAFKGLINWVIDKLNYLPGVDIKKIKQAGGYSVESGMYYLHQGETIVPKQGAGNSGMSFSPNITINASMNGEGDLNQLANRLADLMNEKLRRKVSYTF